VEIPVYKALGDLFVQEGVDTIFALLGDANMHWAIDIAEDHNVRIVHARHENSALAMADGYARTTGRIGIASTTTGPGYTNIMTALTAAVRRRSPLIVFVGDTPLSGLYHGQWVDQRPFAEAAGARFLQLRDPARIATDIRDAFYFARHERRPVVLSAPMDVQARTIAKVANYKPSSTILPKPQRIHPDPQAIGEAAAMIRAAERPIIVAGEGVLKSKAHDAVNRLGDAIGALMATTMRAKGLFEGHPFDLRIAGGYSTDLARELFEKADLVVGAGAGFGHFTTDAGKLFPQAKVIAIDTEPHGIWEGVRTADLHVRSDAKAAIEALLGELKGAARTGYRTNEIGHSIAGDAVDPRIMPVRPGLLDPRSAIREIDEVVPKDFDIVFGNAHFTFNALPNFSGRVPERYHVINDFGAIGHGLPAAIGAAAGRNDGRTILVEGDGSFLMTVQDLETIGREGIKLLICVMNDGAYGAEIHRLRPKKVDDTHTVFGRPDFAAIAKAVGIEAVTVIEPGQFAKLFDAYQASDRAALWDIRIDDRIPSRPFRRLYYGEN
jgi:acetolactate synthase-1/2/3 large subunit